MGNTKDLDVVMDFINRINAGDSAHLSELMTEDHVFQDALGKRFVGKEKMAAGWREYFKMVGDYKIRPDEFFQTNSVFAIFGSASGSSTHPNECGADITGTILTPSPAPTRSQKYSL